VAQNKYGEARLQITDNSNSQENNYISFRKISQGGITVYSEKLIYTKSNDDIVDKNKNNSIDGINANTRNKLNKDLSNIETESSGVL
tara:strand:+ start:377 stop:637 length:261 start_codon:yes stop_codon:yes gene_type:complete